MTPWLSRLIDRAMRRAGVSPYQRALFRRFGARLVIQEGWEPGRN